MSNNNYRIAIDASGLQSGSCWYSGIARASRELISAFLKMPLPFELVLFSQRLRGRGLRDLGFACEQTHLRLPRATWIENLVQTTGLIEKLCHCDLFHAPANYAPIRNLGRSIVTIHDAMFFSYPEEHLGHSLERKRIPPIARGARAVITPSESSKRDIGKHMDVDPAKIQVIPWGVRHDIFHPVKDLDTVRTKLQYKFGLDGPFFLAVSCDIGRKNSPRVLQQYLRFAKQRPDNDLVMIWKNIPDYDHGLKNNSPYGNRVLILETVDDVELSDLYRVATATFFPSFYEGFGLPILESMACGTPVVTSNNSSLAEVGTDSVLYVDPHCDDDIYRAFEILEDNIDLRTQLSQKGVSRSAMFKWENCAQKTIALYQKCLDELA